MDKLKVNEWFLGDIAEYLGLSYSHVRGIIKSLAITPKRKLRQMPIYSSAHVTQIEHRNTKPGPKPTKRNGAKK